MKRHFFLAATFVLVLSLFETSATAQRPEGRRPEGRPGQNGGGRGQAMGPGGQRTPPLLRVFDTDGDGEVSAAEIEAAATALRQLDQNGDGKLTPEELRPAGPRGGQGQQQRGGQRQSRGGQQGGPQGGGRGGRSANGGGPRGGGRDGNPGGGDAAFAKELMSLDENKDSLLSLAELPEHMHDAFALADADKNGSLDEAERLVLASQFRRRELNPSDDERVNEPVRNR